MFSIGLKKSDRQKLHTLRCSQVHGRTLPNTQFFAVLGNVTLNRTTSKFGDDTIRVHTNLCVRAKLVKNGDGLFLETESFTVTSAVPKNPTQVPDCVELELCHFESLNNMAAGRHLGFSPTGSGTVRSADLNLK